MSKTLGARHHEVMQFYELLALRFNLVKVHE